VIVVLVQLLPRWFAIDANAHVQRHIFPVGRVSMRSILRLNVQIGTVCQSISSPDEGLSALVASKEISLQKLRAVIRIRLSQVATSSDPNSRPNLLSTLTKILPGANLSYLKELL